MAQYVDGFVIPIPAKHLDNYRKIASQASKVWIDHGALSYYETVSEDMNTPMGKPFTKLAKAKDDEVVIFAWIVFKSRSHRDKVNAKVMADPRMEKMCQAMKDGPAIMDMKRFTYGGFDVIVRKDAK